MSTTPTPAAVIAALWKVLFDLHDAAALLALSLHDLVLLLKEPGFAEPFDALHEAAKKCLDLKSAQALSKAIALLESAATRTEDPAEHRRLATALTKSANAAARLTRANRATDRRSGRSVFQTHQEAGAAPASSRSSPNPQSKIQNPQSPDLSDLPPQNPPGLPTELRQVYATAWNAAAAIRAHPPQISREEHDAAIAAWHQAHANYTAQHPAAA
jgi:hypothetical protein